MQRRWRALVPVLGATALAGGLLAAPAGAQADEPSTVTLVHAIIGAPVDVYLDGALVERPDAMPPVDAATPFQPQNFLPLGALPAGHAEITLFADDPAAPAPAAAADRTDTPLLTHHLPIPAGQNLSAVAQVLPDATPADGGTPTLTPFENDLTLVPTGQARLSVRNNANTAPVDVYANGTKLVSNLASGSKSDVLVEAGAYQVTVFPAGANPATATALIGPTTVTVEAERLEAVYLAGDADGENLAAFTRDPSIPSTVGILNGIPGDPVDVYLGVDTPANNPTLLTGGLAALASFAVPGGLVGTYDIQVFDAIDSPPTNAADRLDVALIAADALDVAGNQQLTLAAHLQDDDSDPTTVPSGVLTPYTDDLSFAGVGNARVSLRHTADFGPVDVYVGGTADTDRVAQNLANPDQLDLELPAADLPVDAVTVVPTGADPTDPATPAITNTTPLELAPGVLYRIYAVGTPGDPMDPATSTLQLLVTSDPLANLFNPVGPVRIADTRDGSGGVAVARLKPTDPPLRISVNGEDGVPNTGAAAVSLNVTAANTSAAGYLTVFPCTEPAPNASNVNYIANQAGEPNAVVTGLNGEGDFCVTTFAETDVVVDLTGWLAGDSGFTPITPERVGDTRDGTGVAQGKLQPGMVLSVPVDAPATVPDTGVSAVALNVTAANTEANGYLTVYPCDATTPYASNVNYIANEAGAPNAVIGGVDSNGNVCITTFAPTDVIVDVAGYFADDAAFVGTTPTRVGDTRDGVGGVPEAPLQPGQVLEVQVGGEDGVPAAGVNAVALNVTAANTTSPGYLTVFPCGIDTPNSSNVNYVAGQAGQPNAVVTGLAADGTVCVTTFATVDVIVDVTGFFAGTIPAPAAPAPPAPAA